MAARSNLDAARRAGAFALRHQRSPADADQLPPPDRQGKQVVEACEPAMFEPGQIDRVISCGFGRPLSEQVARLTQSSFLTEPIELYHCGPGVIVGGIILSDEAMYWFRRDFKLRYLWERFEEFDDLIVANTRQGCRYFGHWLRDDCTAHEYLSSLGDVRSLRRPDWPDAADYERLFEQDWTEVRFARANRITLQRSMGFDQAKKQRLDTLRRRLREKVVPRHSGETVYLKRGSDGAPRQVANQEALCDTLARSGVKIVSPGNDLHQTLECLVNAKMIISVEGSNLTHAIYALADKSGLIVLQPPRRFYNPHIEWTRLFGMQYGIVVGKDVDEGRGEENSFIVDPEEVLSMIDRVGSAI